MRAIVIGASSGGPAALEEVLNALSPSLQAIVIVIQHLPASFTKSMAERMGKKTPLPFTLIEHQEVLQPGHIYLVPGNRHFFINNNRQAYLLPSDSPVTPSINMSFTSVAEHFGPETIGVVLTGMGDDGTEGAKAIKQVGGWVIVQNEDSSSVYGMPKSVQIAGYADEVLDLHAVAPRLNQLVGAVIPKRTKFKSHE